MKRKLILLGVVSFIAFLILKLPAALAYRLLAPEGVEMAGVEGTAWNGKARSLIVGGVNYGGLSWDLSAWRLITGALAADIELDRPDSGFARGFVALGLGNSVTLKDFNAVMNTAVLNLPTLSQINADLAFILEHAKFEDGWPQSIDGVVNVANLESNLQQASLGNYQIVFEDQDDHPIVGKFSDVDATLSATGDLTLMADRQYTVTGTITPKPNTAAAIRSGLRFLGPQQNDGSVSLNINQSF